MISKGGRTLKEEREVPLKIKSMPMAIKIRGQSLPKLK